MHKMMYTHPNLSFKHMNACIIACICIQIHVLKGTSMYMHVLCVHPSYACILNPKCMYLNTCACVDIYSNACGFPDVSCEYMHVNQCTYICNTFVTQEKLPILIYKCITWPPNGYNALFPGGLGGFAYVYTYSCECIQIHLICRTNPPFLNIQIHYLTPHASEYINWGRYSILGKLVKPICTTSKKTRDIVRDFLNTTRTLSI